MITIKEPNYKHYRRIKSITADKAKELLAFFELRDKEFCDQDELDNLLAEELKLAGSLLFEAIDSGELKYSADECPYDYHPDGYKVYIFCKIQITVADLISWAAKREYNIPCELANLLSKAECSSNFNLQDTQGEDVAQDNAEVPAENEPGTVNSRKEGDDESGAEPANPAIDRIPPKNKGGRPNAYLSEAVECVYQKLGEHGKSGLSKPSKIREFIIFMKEMSTRNNQYFDEFLKERIKSIQIPEEGDCTIITEDKVSLKGQAETIIRGKSYKNNDIAKILTRLRKNNRISI